MIHTKKIRNQDFGILLVRLGLAAIFLAHASAKFMNMSGTIAFFQTLGFATFFAYLVPAIEVLSGLAMLLGVCTDIAGVLIAVVMLVAIFSVKLSRGFLGGYELEFILLMSALGVAFMDNGKFALKCGCGKCMNKK